MTLAVAKAQQLCQDFWKAFCLLVGQKHRVYPAHNEGGIRFSSLAKDSPTQHLYLKDPICLQSWPCEKHPSRKVDIVVQYKMTITVGTQISPGRITESKAQVAYFLGGVGASPPEVQVFRFDYHPETGLPAGDPVFHLQLNDTVLITNALLPQPLRARWCPNYQIVGPGKG
jgi:hypothetical protein